LRLEALEGRELLAGITTFAGTGVAGYTGDGRAASVATLDSPSGVAVDANGNVYIADTSNGVVRKVDSLGNITTFPDPGRRFFATQAVAVDTRGNVYVGVLYSDLVYKVTPSGSVSQFAGGGPSGRLGDGGPATQATLTPFGIAVDSRGNVYIADSYDQRIRKVNPSGTITTFAGNGIRGSGGEGGSATAAQLDSPNGVAVDANGNVFIADTGNERIRKVDSSGIITTVAGTGIAGFSGDGGSATLAQLSTPLGVAVDGNGDIFITDADYQRIRKVTPAGIISTFAGGYPSGLGDGGPATSAHLQLPVAVAVDTVGGKIYIADSADNRIRAITSLINSNSTTSQSAVVGQAVASPPSVRLTDAFDNPLVNVPVTFTVTGGSGTVNGGSGTSATVYTTATGVATLVSWTLGSSPGTNNNILTASATGIPGSPVIFTASGVVGQPASLAFTAGTNNQTGTVGQALRSLSVLVTDSLNNPVPGAVVTFTVATGGGSLAGGMTTSNITCDAHGVATLDSWTLGRTAGINNNTLYVFVSGHIDPVILAASAMPDVAAQLKFAVEPSTAVPGQLITPAISILVEDRYGNIVTNDHSLIRLGLGKLPAGASLYGTTAVNAMNGRATFNTLFLSTVGVYALTASSSPLPDIASQDFSVTRASLTASTQLALVNQPVTFNFRAFALTPFNGSPYGTATFYLNNSPTPLATTPVTASGLATFTLPFSQASAPGTPDLVTAVYNDGSTTGTGSGGSQPRAAGDNPNSASVPITVVAVTDTGIPVTIVLGPGDNQKVATIDDGASPGTVVGNLQTNVAAVGQFRPATYTLPPDVKDNNLFQISGGSIAIKVLARFASAQSYQVEVRSSIGSGDPVPADFTFYVAPSVTSLGKTTTLLNSSANPSLPGQGVSFTATVTAGGGPISGVGPPENVLFVVDGNPVGTYALLNGTATLASYSLPSGKSHTVIAIYTGDGNLEASSGNLTQTVGTVTPPKATITPVATPRTSAVGVVAVNFSTPVTGVTLGAFSLTRDGAVVSLTGVDFTTLPGLSQYTLDLSKVTAALGNYVLTLNATGSGIQDGAGTSLVDNASISFQVTNTATLTATIEPVPTPRTTPVGAVTTDFASAVIGVTLQAFSLTRDGSPVPLGAIPVTQLQPSQYSIDLTSVTASPGNYVFTLTAAGSGIRDAANNPLAANASLSFQVIGGATPAKTQVAAVDPASNTWYLNTTSGVVNFPFGLPGWIPVSGDWTGAGKTQVGVVDPATNTWYLNTASGVVNFPYGLPGWKPVTGDWSGTGKTQVGAVDPATNTWYLNTASGVVHFPYGLPGWIPVSGDWTGTGKTQVGVVDPASNTWYLNTASGVVNFPFGLPGWKPVTGDWTGTGKTQVGVVDPATNTWYLNTASGVVHFPYGAPGWIPVTGAWNGASARSATNRVRNDSASTDGLAGVWRGVASVARTLWSDAGKDASLTGPGPEVSQAGPLGNYASASPDAADPGWRDRAALTDELFGAADFGSPRVGMSHQAEAGSEDLWTMILHERGDAAGLAESVDP
jgi:sugar lactone lactonase YvrE